METEVNKLLKKFDTSNKCSLEVIKGEELQQKGLKLFYEVGKGAQIAPRYMAVKYIGNSHNTES